MDLNKYIGKTKDTTPAVFSYSNSRHEYLDLSDSQNSHFKNGPTSSSTVGRHYNNAKSLVTPQVHGNETQVVMDSSGKSYQN